MIEGRNPCDVCESSNFCDGCVLNTVWSRNGECYNDKCFVNHSDCGCLLGLDDVCKASTCYKEREDD